MNKYLFSLVLLGTSLVLSAQASDIDSFLEESTCVVARVSLSQIDLPVTLKVLQEQFPDLLPPQAQTTAQVIGGGLISSLQSAGVKDIYVTLSTLEITNGHASLILPCENTQVVADLLTGFVGMLPSERQYSVTQLDHIVLVADAEVTTRLTDKPEANRPHLSQTMDSDDLATLHIAFGLRDSLRLSVANIWPTEVTDYFPIKLSPQQMSRDINAISVVVNLPPELSVRLTAQTTDQAATQRVALVMKDLSSKYFGDLVVQTSETTASIESRKEQLLALIQDLSKATLPQSKRLKLMTIMRGIHDFNRFHDGLPPRMTITESGVPLLSWRVHLLPVMGFQALYDQFYLDEPWDSTHNMTLVSKMPDLFRLPDSIAQGSGLTCIQFPLAEQSPWNDDKPEPLQFRTIIDGIGSTICLIIAPQEKAVVWTKPEDLLIRTEQVMEDVYGDRLETTFAMFSGLIRSIAREEVTPEILRALLTNQGDEDVMFPFLD